MSKKWKVRLWLAIGLLALAAIGRAQQPQTSTDPIYNVNSRYTNGVAPGYWATNGSGLTLNISAGTANCAGTIVTYAGSTLTMTNSTTNYVYLDTTASCAPASNTTGFSSTTIPIATVVTSGGAISTITDDRTMQSAASTSGTGVTTTGSPASGNLAKFSGSTTITNGDLSGDCTTSGTLAITCTKTSGTAFAASATTDATNASNILSGTLSGSRLNATYLTVDGTGSPPTNYQAVAAGTNIVITPNAGTHTFSIAATAGSGGTAALSTCVAASGSATAYTCTASPAVSSLTTGLTIAFEPDVASGASPTLNVSSLGAKNVMRHGGLVNMVAGDWTASMWTILVYDGTNWEDIGWPAFTTIPAFSWDNQGSSTATDTAGTEMVVTGATNNTEIVRYVSAPATPYTLTAQIVPNWVGNNTKDCSYGLTFRQSSTGKLVVLEFSKNTSDVPYIGYANWTTSTSYSSNPYINTSAGWGPITGWPQQPNTCMRIRDDGTNLSFWYSMDCLNFLQVNTNLSRTAFMTGGPNQIGWTQRAATSGSVIAATLMKWTVTSP